jgi:hypothetical protein
MFRVAPRRSATGGSVRASGGKAPHLEELQAELADAIDQREEGGVVDVSLQDCLDREDLRAELAERGDERSTEATLDSDLGLRG